MKKWIGIALVLCVSASAFAKEEISYLAGELPPAAKIEKVLSAGNPADVLLLSSAPNKLLGLAGFNMENVENCFLQHNNLYQPWEKLPEKAVRSRQRKLWHYNRI